MKNKVLGIIGYGAIGKRFHKKISGFGFSKVLVSDPYIDKKMIGKKQLSLMKKNSILINTSRGAVLDEQAYFPL